MADWNHYKGKLAEQAACFFLYLKGYRPLRGNVKGGIAEIDLIVGHGDCLVLVEVKYRKTRQQAHMAIHPAQKQRLQRQFRVLLSRYPQFVSARADAIFLFASWPYVDHVQNIWALEQQ